METINIITSEKQIPIIRDGQQVGILSFNPNDVLFAERLYRLISDFEAKSAEYQERYKSLGNDTGAGLQLLSETVTYIRSQIDGVFGQGTSQMVFGNTYSLDVFSQFFTAIMPFFQAARAEKVAKYTKPQKASRVMK